MLVPAVCVSDTAFRLRESAMASAALANSSPVVAAAVDSRRPVSEWEATCSQHGHQQHEQQCHCVSAGKNAGAVQTVPAVTACQKCCPLHHLHCCKRRQSMRNTTPPLHQLPNSTLM